eukprot:g2139.t1
MFSRRRSDACENKRIPPEVSPALLSRLLQMGFDKDRSIQALLQSKATTLEDAVIWLIDYKKVDNPSTASAVSNTERELTYEERRRRAEQLRREAQQRHRNKAKGDEAIREREQMRKANEAAALVQKEREKEHQKLIEKRKKEKEADKLAKAKVLQQLEMDKIARRVKSGRPAKLTAAERRKEEEKKRAKEQERVERLTKDTYFAQPKGMTERLRTKLVEMRNNTNQTAFTVACETLLKYIGNIVKHPNDEKYRRIKLTNAAFLQRVASVRGSVEFLEECGFTQLLDRDFLILPLKDLVLSVLDVAGTVLNSAMTNPFFG